MKRAILNFAAVLCGGMLMQTASAQRIDETPIRNQSLFSEQSCTWTPLQFGLGSLAVFSSYTNIYGLNINPLISFQHENVYGLNVALFNLTEYSDSAGVTISLATRCENHYGLLFGVTTVARRNYGLQCGVLNIVRGGGSREMVNFVQLGVFNRAGSGLQIGLLNSNPNSVMPLAPIFNYSNPLEKPMFKVKD
ncbi:MAG: hypothetical protein RR060_08605 [Victivallaceae bacterium]